MEDSDKTSTIIHYNDQLKKHGYGPQALGWKNGRHKLRYDILLSQWKLDGATLLDFGCGFGDMYQHCQDSGHRVIYEGIDINAELIETGKKVYPTANLQVKDVFQTGLASQYDVIVSSGTHNLKLKNNWEFIKDTFDLFSAHATTGFAVNFLSNRVEYELDHTYHSDPVRILDLAYKYSNRVVLRNDYMPFEFTVFVDMRRDFDPTFVVYPEYLAQARS